MAEALALVTGAMRMVNAMAPCHVVCVHTLSVKVLMSGLLAVCKLHIGDSVSQWL